MAKVEKVADMNSALSAEIVTMTPAMALKWIEDSNFDNRVLSDRNVDKIARDIKAGNWVYDGNSIKFDTQGNLIDGQHRLYAIVRSQKTVNLLVVRDLADEAKGVIDTGKSRTGSDVLHFRGYTNTNVLAAVCRLKIGYDKCKGDMKAWSAGRAGDRLSPIEICNEVTNTPELVDAVSALQNFKFVRKTMGLGVPTFCYYLFHKIDPYQAENFFHVLEKGISLQEGHPILTLRNYLIVPENRYKIGGRGNSKPAHLMAVIIKSWNAYRTGKTTQRMNYFPDREDYPMAK